jgi:hypothetical protein
MNTLMRTMAAVVLLSGLLSGTVAATAASTAIAAPAAPAKPAPKAKISFPPSADLSYSIQAKQKGMPIEGDAVMRWNISGNAFSVSNEARAMLIGKILDTKSEGSIDASGLAPTSITEKRFRRPATTTSFDRSENRITFSSSDEQYPIQGGEQDRNSVIWQLAGVARGMPKKFKKGFVWKVVVAGQRDADEWVFKVVGQDTIRTPLGELKSLHVQRVPAPDSKDQLLDIWLAPTLEWYPIRVRYSEDSGDYIEQTLQELNRKTP